MNVETRSQPSWHTSGTIHPLKKYQHIKFIHLLILCALCPCVCTYMPPYTGRLNSGHRDWLQAPLPAHCPNLVFLRQDLSLAWSLSRRKGCLGCKPQASACLLPSRGITVCVTTPGFWGQNSWAFMHTRWARLYFPLSGVSPTFSTSMKSLLWQGANWTSPTPLWTLREPSYLVACLPLTGTFVQP